MAGTEPGNKAHLELHKEEDAGPCCISVSQDKWICQFESHLLSDFLIHKTNTIIKMFFVCLNLSSRLLRASVRNHTWSLGSSEAAYSEAFRFFIFHTFYKRCSTLLFYYEGFP